MNYSSKLHAFTPGFDNLSFKELLKYIDPQKTEKILEIGCKKGTLVKKLQDLGYNVFGIDINPNNIKKGVAKNLKVMDAINLDFPDKSFDKVYSLHTFEHIADIEKAFQELARVLKPGGKAVLVYPREPIRGLFALPTALFVHGNPLLARKLHIHKLNPNKVKQLSEKSGPNHVKSIFPVSFLPQYMTTLMNPRTNIAK